FRSVEADVAEVIDLEDDLRVMEVADLKQRLLVWPPPKHPEQKLCKLISRSGLLERLFSPECIHIEVLKRSQEIACFMASHRALTDAHLACLWEAARQSRASHESIRHALFRVVTEVTGHLPHGQLAQVHRAVAALPLAEYDAHTLSLLRELAEMAIDAGFRLQEPAPQQPDAPPPPPPPMATRPPSGTGSSRNGGVGGGGGSASGWAAAEPELPPPPRPFWRLVAVDLLWTCIRDESPLDRQLHDQALLTLASLGQSVRPFSARLELLASAAAALRSGDSTAQAHRVLYSMVETLQKKAIFVDPEEAAEIDWHVQPAGRRPPPPQPQVPPGPPPLLPPRLGEHGGADGKGEGGGATSTDSAGASSGVGGADRGAAECRTAGHDAAAAAAPLRPPPPPVDENDNGGRGHVDTTPNISAESVRQASGSGGDASIGSGGGGSSSGTGAAPAPRRKKPKQMVIKYETLVQEYGLRQAVVAGLLRYKELAAAAAAERGLSPAEVDATVLVGTYYPHFEALDYRISLFLLLVAEPMTALLEQQVESLWAALVDGALSPAEQDSALELLCDVARTSKPVFSALARPICRLMCRESSSDNGRGGGGGDGVARASGLQRAPYRRCGFELRRLRRPGLDLFVKSMEAVNRAEGRIVAAADLAAAAAAAPAPAELQQVQQPPPLASKAPFTGSNGDEAAAARAITATVAVDSCRYACSGEGLPISELGCGL
ncbi:unnamed protein product, partial [Phaeothamnion confervicola]